MRGENENNIDHTIALGDAYLIFISFHWTRYTKFDYPVSHENKSWIQKSFNYRRNGNSLTFALNLISLFSFFLLSLFNLSKSLVLFHILKAVSCLSGTVYDYQ